MRDLVTGRPGTRPRALLATLAAALAVALLAPAGAVAQAPGGRTPWATVNICDPPQRPGSVGVRVSVPNRRDLAQWIRVRMQFFDAGDRAWRVVRRGGDAGFKKLSDGGGRVMGGTTFRFTGLREGRRLKLRGLVDVEWRRRGRALSRARLVTRGGHADPDDPLLRRSQAQCEIRR